MRARLGLLTCLAVACGSSHAAPDATTLDGPAADASGPLALGPLMPQAVADDGSAIIAAPHVIPITYDGDPDRADIEAFFPDYAASPAWALQTAEYGIGPVTVDPPIHLAGSAVASDTELRSLITTSLSGATPAWGSANEDTLYSVTLPLDTPFIDDIGETCCGGYHDDVIVDGVDVAYALQCPCDNLFPPPTTALQALTFALSHELVEGVTDPRYEHAVGWGDLDPAHQVWAYITDGELADLCEFTNTALWTNPPNMTYTIARIWSNAAAAAGTDPCIGDPAATYAQTVPEQPDDVTIELFGASTPTKGTKVALGASGTITARIAGTPGSGPYTVFAYDAATLYFGAKTPLLTFTQPTQTFQPGDTVTIPVTVHGVDTFLGGSGAEGFELDTQPPSGNGTTYFYGLVGQ